jgi:transposase
VKAYSVDLKRKVVGAVLSGTPKVQVARAFGLGISAVKRYVSKAQRGESLPQEAPRQETQARRDRDEAPQAGPQRTTDGNPLTKGASSWRGRPG